MITINKPELLAIFNNNTLELPKNWDGHDFYVTLDKHFAIYIDNLRGNISSNDLKKIETVCKYILKSVKEYHNGFPYQAFKSFSSIMEKLKDSPIRKYQKSGFPDIFHEYDPLKLYRIRNVEQNTIYERASIFHTPYFLRSKISTCRYSISGYPCLYLGTSLQLCCEEVPKSCMTDFTIASRFQIARNYQENGEIDISVIEIGIKPSDFIELHNNNTNDHVSDRRSHLDEIDLDNPSIMGSYLYWYPLIAACSFIRTNKKDPFASEYIIPQLLMQWIRSQSKENKLVGIRYFSCASTKASELGLNYVFPVSGEKDPIHQKYCKILTNAFKITKPIFIHEFNSVKDCQEALIIDTDTRYL